MKVDLTDQPFNSVGITFEGTHYKLFHGDENNNIALQEAFPHYFEKLHKVEVEEVIAKDIEDNITNKFIPPSIVRWYKLEPHTSIDNFEEIELNKIQPITELDGVIEDMINFDKEFENSEICNIDTLELDEGEEPVSKEQALIADDILEKQINAEYSEDSYTPLSTIIDEIEAHPLFGISEKLDDLSDYDKQQKKENIETTENSTNKTQEFIDKVINKSSDIVNSILDFVMSLRFIVMTAMLMIAGSAISFDIDGWQETYHRLGTDQVTFIIVSLYVAKMAIIKILSVGIDTTTTTNKISDKISFYFNYYMLRVVLIASLFGMIFVSSVGIYSSLAVNTVGDAKTIVMGNSKISFIQKRIDSVDARILSTRGQMPELERNIKTQLQALDDSIPIIKEKIKSYKISIKDLPTNFKTKRRYMVSKLNAMSDEIFQVQVNKNKIVQSKASKIQIINNKIENLQNERDRLVHNKESALITLNNLATENSNKSLNFTADLLGVPLLELLKFINMLMTLVLELTYLALTALVVRLDKYTIRK